MISELMAINYGRRHFDRVAIFRPHNVYGPDMGTSTSSRSSSRQLDERMRDTPA